MMDKYLPEMLTPDNPSNFTYTYGQRLRGHFKWYELRYGKDGFMLLVPAPQDLVTGEPNQTAIATVHIEKYD